MAINMVGRCLDQGWGVAKSPHLAAPWFRKAAEAGLDWGMYNLATLLALGSGVPEDRHEAFLWLRRAADLNHAKSMNLLGGFYEDGWTVQRDMNVARGLYHAAAVAGDFRGQFNYARMLAAEGDVDAALRWLRKVPQTATPAFLAKMKRFLRQWPAPELQAFAERLQLQAVQTPGRSSHVEAGCCSADSSSRRLEAGAGEAHARRPGPNGMGRRKGHSRFAVCARQGQCAAFGEQSNCG